MTRSEKIEAAAQDLCDNRLGWSDGRNPYAHPEFWEALGDALALPPDAPQQPQQDDGREEREAFDNAVAVSILRVACQHIDGLDISKQSSCPEDMAMWAVTYIDRLVAEGEARCQCADMQGGKLCRACLEDEEATDV